MLKTRITGLGFAVLLPVSLFAQNKPDRNLVEDKISAHISHLPEVVAMARRVDSLSKGTRHLASLIYERPSANSKYYKVKVVEDNGVSLVTYFNFFVSEDTLFESSQRVK